MFINQNYKWYSVLKYEIKNVCCHFKINILKLKKL